MLSLEDIISIKTPTEIYLQEALDLLTKSEKEMVAKRIDQAFSQIHEHVHYPHPPSVYARLFSYLVQIEMIGIMLPTRILSTLGEDHQIAPKMQQQLLDEVFHALLFLKLAKYFSVPYASTPIGGGEGLEKIKQHVSQENDISIALVMLYLVGECIVEEFVETLIDAGVMPNILKIVLEDESRHVSDGDIYQLFSMPDKARLTKTLHELESLIIDYLFLDPRQLMPSITLLGLSGAQTFFNNVIRKHRLQLDKLGISSNPRWQLLTENATQRFSVFDNLLAEGATTPLDQSFTRTTLMNMWGEPNSPAMSCEFSLDVTDLGFFEKRFPSETVVLLVLMAISQTLSENPQWRRYIRNREIYQSKKVLTSLVVKLPNQADHVGEIIFKNCHEHSFEKLTTSVQRDLAIMAYCHKMALDLSKQYPDLKHLYKDYFSERRYSPFEFGSFGMPVVSVSNLGSWGIERATTPLFPGESSKLVLGKIERKQVWDNTNACFKIMDQLPVGLSVDHRAYDATEAPLALQRAFKQKKQQFLSRPYKRQSKLSALSELNLANHGYRKKIAALLKHDLRYGYESLVLASQVWLDEAEDQQYPAEQSIKQTVPAKEAEPSMP